MTTHPVDPHALRLTAHARRRDLVVIAASAGELSALLQIVGALPADFETPDAHLLYTAAAPQAATNIATLARTTATPSPGGSDP